MEKEKCVFCGKELTSSECNNPEPIIDGADFDCCKECSDKFVIPARMGQLKGNMFTPNGRAILFYNNKYMLFDAVSKKYGK